MITNLDPRQATIPGTEPVRGATLARRAAAQPLRPKVSQRPCDHGLFSDCRDQLDLVDVARAVPGPTVSIDDHDEMVTVTIPAGARASREFIARCHETAAELGYGIVFR